ncbi:hypothetical protein CRE_29227 [Caenorhabditis remanei]|uniref:Uncharacterized protein n=1 Tax=Caenorhabditis remanei TaxID=31234 RepID=E3NKI0_CAERE|nr:hypothetical protein CRE_29227 [Caenorhabditis remanei]
MVDTRITNEHYRPFPANGVIVDAQNNVANPREYVTAPNFVRTNLHDLFGGPEDYPIDALAQINITLRTLGYIAPIGAQERGSLMIHLRLQNLPDPLVHWEECVNRWAALDSEARKRWFLLRARGTFQPPEVGRFTSKCSKCANQLYGYPLANHGYSECIDTVSDDWSLDDFHFFIATNLESVCQYCSAKGRGRHRCLPEMQRACRKCGAKWHQSWLVKSCDAFRDLDDLVVSFQRKRETHYRNVRDAARLGQLRYPLYTDAPEDYYETDGTDTAIIGTYKFEEHGLMQFETIPAQMYTTTNQYHFVRCDSAGQDTLPIYFIDNRQWELFEDRIRNRRRQLDAQLLDQNRLLDALPAPNNANAQPVQQSDEENSVDDEELSETGSDEQSTVSDEETDTNQDTSVTGDDGGDSVDVHAQQRADDVTPDEQERANQESAEQQIAQWFPDAKRSAYDVSEPEAQQALRAAYRLSKVQPTFTERGNIVSRIRFIQEALTSVSESNEAIEVFDVAGCYLQFLEMVCRFVANTMENTDVCPRTILSSRVHWITEEIRNGLYFPIPDCRCFYTRDREFWNKMARASWPALVERLVRVAELDEEEEPW